MLVYFLSLLLSQLLLLFFFHFYSQGSVPLSSMNADCLKYGLAAYAVGEVGNLYHHYILSTLRTTDKNGKVVVSKADKAGADGVFDVKSNYSVPKGGLFDYVTMPHYLFELIAWLGIAVVSQDLNVYLVFASMCTYLLTRAKATKIWYLKNVNNYPKERKVLVPFII
jgi:3-oxo-5-alpha-steroid 4-dehydrogenase